MPTVILAAIGGTTLILTAAARIPAALAEFLRACISVVTAARELRTALSERTACDDSYPAGEPKSPCRYRDPAPGDRCSSRGLPHRMTTLVRAAGPGAGGACAPRKMTLLWNQRPLTRVN
jgi:hypothetical protein